MWVMSRRATPLARLCVLTIIGLLLSALAVVPGDAQAVDQDGTATISIWRVSVEDRSDVDRLTSGDYDLVEGRGDNHLLVVGDAAVAERLRADGFEVTRDRALNPVAGVPTQILADGTIQALDLSYNGGYRTLDEHYAHLDRVAADHPDLAVVYDYGDSWRKSTGRANPNDLKVICLTNRQPGDCQLDPNDAKPRSVIMAAIHARELQTAEVAWRLIDELVDRYGSDPDITMVMDTSEVWVIPVANPDGREIVEQGGNAPYLQRKNANNILGDCAVPPSVSNQHGVDLNRNASVFNWGGPGTSTNPCAQTYRGPSAASEPEQQGLESLFANLWLDQKDGPGDPAPTSVTGSFISIHSYSDLILFPSASGQPAPNDAALRAMASRMSHFNRYRAGRAPELLYEVTGATDDHVYFEYGVPSFTYELSPVGGACGGFTPPYSCIDSTLWPLNRDALLYGLKVAEAPYRSSRGPTTLAVQAPAAVERGSAIEVSATVDDDALGPEISRRPSANPVTLAEYYVDQLPGQGGQPVSMQPADGSFNTMTEAVRALVPTDSLADGPHTIYIRGRNAAGYWGPFSAVTVRVDDASDAAGIDGRVTDSNGSTVAGVKADLFTENRGRYLGSAATGANGIFAFDDLDPGCYTVTFIAPANSQFSTGRYFNVEGCVDAGQRLTGVDAVLMVDGGVTTAVGGTVTDRGGASRPDVTVDLFRADADGNRLGYLRSTTTGADGGYRFELAAAGCYTVVMIAPGDDVFESGSRYAQGSSCLADGQEALDLNAVIQSVGPPPGGTTVVGTVLRADDSPASLKADLFQATADGTRGAFLEAVSTDGAGRYSFDVTPGCFVVVIVASDNDVFDNGTRWYQEGGCVEAGAELKIDAQLAT